MRFRHFISIAWQVYTAACVCVCVCACLSVVYVVYTVVKWLTSQDSVSFIWWLDGHSRTNLAVSKSHRRGHQITIVLNLTPNETEWHLWSLLVAKRQFRRSVTWVQWLFPRPTEWQTVRLWNVAKVETTCSLCTRRKKLIHTRSICLLHFWRFYSLFAVTCRHCITLLRDMRAEGSFSSVVEHFPKDFFLEIAAY